MSSYESQIARATFGVVTQILFHNPLSEIHYALYVRQRAVLSQLADDLDRKFQEGQVDAQASLLEKLLRQGDLLLSSRSYIQKPAPHVVDATRIPAHACCEVLCWPPFYLVHLPGLFEGKFVRHEVGTHSRPTNRQAQSKGIKF